MTRFRVTRFSTSRVMLPAALAVAADLTAVTAAAPANAATTYTVTNRARSVRGAPSPRESTPPAR